FELYGRHVVLKAYNGQGDYISEDQGQNLAGAQADAVSAHDMGAFGDVTFALGASEAYEQDLAAEHVISFSGAAEPQSWFASHAPYEYSVQGPSGTNAIHASANVVCRRLNGMPAIFSGDPASTTKPRVFGIIYPENPNYAQEVDQYRAEVLSECGLKIDVVKAYTINVSQYSQQAISIMALMSSKHVTTILCACDPIFPILLTPAASSQNYHPEWFAADFGDPVTQDYDSSQWSHSVAGGTEYPGAAKTEAYQVYQRANPGHQPAEEPPTSPPYFYVPYYIVLHVFEALQAAGPNLTPATFQAGVFSLPPSGIDPIGGLWVFGPQVYDPVSSFGLVWWDAKTTSSFDAKKGTYRACNGGQIYTIFNLAALAGPHQQLNCFGR
ncbi:MAG: type 1 periplasmic-binding domain-containing protein, partial [Acidimicrobiales bacterium]